MQAIKLRHWRLQGMLYESDNLIWFNSRSILQYFGMQQQQTIAIARKDDDVYLSFLFVKIAIKVFGQLLSFVDVFVLTTTCSRLWTIWLTNVLAIYNDVERRCISCERHARSFLATQQGHSSMQVSSLNARDVIHLLQNANEIERAIVQFEREIVSKVRSKSS